jgi:hypothetical protein
MAKLIVIGCFAISFSLNAQPQPQPVVYDQMGSELCHCVQTSVHGNFVKLLDSCYLITFKKHYEPLRRMGLDSSNFNDKMHIVQNVLEVLKDDCPDTYSKYATAMATPSGPDSAALSFTGEFVSQVLTANKKSYHLILRSKENGEIKDFYSDLKVDIHPNAFEHTVTVKYKIVVNAKTKKEKFVVLSNQLVEIMPVEHQ